MNYSIDSDGSTVWVNDETGCCIGRFSWKGVDVHATGPEQMKGKHCLDCVTGLDFDESWDRFKASMLEHHGVEVPELHKPVDRGFPSMIRLSAFTH